MSRIDPRAPDAAVHSEPEPLVCGPEKEAPPAKGTAKGATVAGAAQNSVEPHKANDVNQGLAGRVLEHTYTEALARMPPASSYVLEGELELSVKLSGKGKAKMEVERTQEGDYVVRLKAGVSGGVGITGKGGKGSARIGVEGEVVLKFKSAAEAADALAAMTQKAASQAVPLPMLVELAGKHGGLLDKDTDHRLLALTSKVATVEAAVVGELGATVENHIAKAGLKLEGTASFKVDFERGALVLEGEVMAEGKAKAGLELIPGLKLEGSVAAVEASSRAFVRAELKLTPEELEQLKAGTLDVSRLMKRSPIDVSLHQEVKVNHGGLDLTATRAFENASDLPAMYDPRGTWEMKASVGYDAGIGGELKLPVGELKLKATASRDLPLMEGSLTLHDGFTTAKAAMEAQAQDEKRLQALQASSRCR